MEETKSVESAVTFVVHILTARGGVGDARRISRSLSTVRQQFAYVRAVVNFRARYKTGECRIPYRS